MDRWIDTDRYRYVADRYRYVAHVADNNVKREGSVTGAFLGKLYIVIKLSICISMYKYSAIYTHITKIYIDMDTLSMHVALDSPV